MQIVDRAISVQRTVVAPDLELEQLRTWRARCPAWILVLPVGFLAGCHAAPMEELPDTRMEPGGLVLPEKEASPVLASDPGGLNQESSSPDGTLQELLASMGVRYLPAERRLEVPGWVNLQSGLVEVFACAPEGKTHEAVVVLDCVPSGLHAGLLALGLEPGTPLESGTEAEYRAPRGDRVEIMVRWTGADGETRTARAEDWIWDQKRGSAMEPTTWIFTGSFLQAIPGVAGATYAANHVKSLVTTYHDATSVLENPWPDGVDDAVYYSNDKAVPPVGTPITLLFLEAR